MSKIFLITAPSGAGKTTLAQSLAKRDLWKECISHTTRPMREGEVDGVTYYFVSREKFESLEKDNYFAEKVEYNGNLYGVSHAEIDSVLNEDKHVFIIVENDGYNQIKRKYPDSIGIFIHMSKEDCMANMLLRGDKLKDALERIELYNEEMEKSIEYDYVIRNVRDKKFETENVIRSIISQYNTTYSALIKTEPPHVVFNKG